MGRIRAREGVSSIGASYLDMDKSDPRRMRRVIDGCMDAEANLLYCG